MKLIHTLIALGAFIGGSAIAAEKKPLQIYILAGQSNMQGHARISTFEHIGMDPATKPMLGSWRICCDWAYCPPEPFCRLSTGLSVTWPESACNWCAAAPAIYWLSRTSWRANGR